MDAAPDAQKREANCRHGWRVIVRPKDGGPGREVCHYCKADVGQADHDLAVMRPRLYREAMKLQWLLPNPALQFLHEIRVKDRLTWHEMDKLRRVVEGGEKIKRERQVGRT